MALKKLNDLDQYKAYFEDIAKTHKEILHVDGNDCHFYLVDISKVLTDFFRSGFNGNILVVEYPEFAPEGANMSQLQERLFGAFYVVGSACQPDDLDDKQTTLKFSLDTGRQIVAKMVKDLKENTLLGFDPRKLRINKVGPLGDGYYFYRFEFEILNQSQGIFTYDVEKWS